MDGIEDIGMAIAIFFGGVALFAFGAFLFQALTWAIGTLF